MNYRTKKMVGYLEIYNSTYPGKKITTMSDKNAFDKILHLLFLTVNKTVK